MQEIDWNRSEPVILRGGSRNGWCYERASALTMASVEADSWRGWPWLPTGKNETVSYKPSKTAEPITYEAEVWEYNPQFDGIALGRKP